MSSRPKRKRAWRARQRRRQPLVGVVVLKINGVEVPPGVIKNFSFESQR